MTECENIKNIVFWSDNKPVDEWTLTASSSSANNPVSNLKNTAPTITWKSSAANTNHYIEGTSVPSTIPKSMGEGRAGIVLVNYVTPAATGSDIVNLKIYDAAVGGNLLYNQSFPLSNYANLSSDQRELINEIRPYPRRVYYIDPTEYTAGLMMRWRISFIYAIPQFCELGYVFVTKAFQPVMNIGPGGAASFAIDKTQVKEPWGGNQFSNSRPQKSGLEITPNKMPIKGATDIYEWMRLTRVNGSRKPVFVDPYPKYPDVQFASTEAEEAAFNLFNQVYGTLDGNVKISRETWNKMRMSGSLKVDESL